MACVPAYRPGPGSVRRRRPRRARVLVVLLSVIALAGCSGLGRGDANGPGAPGAAPRLGYLSGNQGITVQQGSVQSDTGCPIDTTRFEPRHPRTAVPVILAPGFLRDRRHLTGLARALADHGIPAVTLDLCNRRPWDAAPVRNALDMIAVARRLGARQVVYGGFSAGALAALIAGRLDPHTRGVLALDLVDQASLGVGMARALDRPLLGLAGDPAACNAYNNGLKVFVASPGGRVARIPGAGHCDFESPTDWLCESVCAGVDGGSPARRQAIIEAAVTAAADLVGLPGLVPGPDGVKGAGVSCPESTGTADLMPPGRDAPAPLASPYQRQSVLRSISQ